MISSWSFQLSRWLQPYTPPLTPLAAPLGSTPPPPLGNAGTKLPAPAAAEPWCGEGDIACAPPDPKAEEAP